MSEDTPTPKKHLIRSEFKLLPAVREKLSKGAAQLNMSENALAGLSLDKGIDIVVDSLTAPVLKKAA